MATDGGVALAPMQPGDGDDTLPAFLDTVGTPDLADGPYAISLEARPKRGFQLIRWETNYGIGHNSDITVNVTEADGPLNAWALFTPLPTLKLTPKLAEGSPGEPECAGYITADPAQKYYTYLDYVTLDAIARPGYVFVSWEGQGAAFDPNTGDLIGQLDGEAPITANPIQVYIGEFANEEREIVASFAEVCSFIEVPGVSICGPQLEVETFQDDWTNVAYYDLPCASLFDYFGGITDIDLNPYREVCFQWTPCLKTVCDSDGNESCCWTAHALWVRVGYFAYVCPNCKGLNATSDPEEYCRWKCIIDNYPSFGMDTRLCSGTCTMIHEQYHATVELQRAIEEARPYAEYLDAVRKPVEEYGSKQDAYDGMFHDVGIAMIYWADQLEEKWRSYSDCEAMMAEADCYTERGIVWEPDPENPPECDDCSEYEDLAPSGCE